MEHRFVNFKGGTQNNRQTSQCHAVKLGVFNNKRKMSNKSLNKSKLMWGETLEDFLEDLRGNYNRIEVFLFGGEY